MEPTKVDLHALARDVAKWLGNGWSYAAPKGEVYAHHATLAGPAGALLVFICHGPRCEISGGLAGENGHKLYYDARSYKEAAPCIGVAVTKPAKTIAADIQRRLLPGVLALVSLANERGAQQSAHEALTQATARRIASAVGGKLWEPRYQNDKSTARVDLPTADDDQHLAPVEVWGERVDLKLSVTAEQAIAILRLVGL